MGFVNALRMRNLFPVNSDLGSAQIDLSGPDPMQEAIDAYNKQADRNRLQPTGLQRVADAGMGMPQPPKFGGSSSQGNPGAGIMDRSVQNSERLWREYNTPKPVAPISGPVPMSNDEAYYARQEERQNKETIANATAANAGNKGWDIINITDPADPTKQISARYNKLTNETQPIDLNGGQITRMGSAKDIQAANDKNAARDKSRQNLRDKSQQSMDILNQLLDPKTDKLTNEAEWATGGSSWTGSIPLPTDAYAGASKLEQLGSQQILGLIQAMKDASATGATGMGTLSNKDLGVLENSATLLKKRGLPEETIRQELIKVRGILQGHIAGTNQPDAAAPDAPAPINNTTPNGNRIKVRQIGSGKTGTISSGAFDPSKYEIVQ